jgi:uncharacterized membrane protein
MVALRKPLLLVFFIIILFPVILFFETKSSSSLINQNEKIECIIVYSSGCFTCFREYNDSVLPFYEAYRDHNSIDFTIIDFSTDPEFFWEEIQRLNINTSQYESLPWVIFVWGDKNIQVLDESQLYSIESTFFNILEDVNYNPPPPSTKFESLDVELAIIAGIVTLTALVIVLFLIFICNYRLRPTQLLKRISWQRFGLIIGFSVLSIFALTYQLLDHLQGDCGCPFVVLTKAALFRQYDHIDLFGLEIPYALIGLGLMSAMLVQVFLIGTLPIPLSFTIPGFLSHTINNRKLRFFYFFLIFQMGCAILALFYLLYLELFVIEMFCFFCTVSQIVIILNTGLIATWNPFT